MGRDKTILLTVFMFLLCVCHPILKIGIDISKTLSQKRKLQAIGQGDLHREVFIGVAFQGKIKSRKKGAPPVLHLRC